MSHAYCLQPPFRAAASAVAVAQQQTVEAEPPVVLVAAADEELRTRASLLLFGAEYDVVPVGDGEQLLDYLALSRREPETFPAPDVIVAEESLRTHEGLDAVALVAAGHFRTPVVLLADPPANGLRARGHRTGAIFVDASQLEGQLEDRIRALATHL